MITHDSCLRTSDLSKQITRKIVTRKLSFKPRGSLVNDLESRCSFLPTTKKTHGPFVFPSSHHDQRDLVAMRVSKVYTENFLASLLWLMMAGCAVSSCALTGIRAVAPSNAPPIFSARWQPADGALPHQGIAIDGRGYFDHEILAPSDGIVVRIRGDHVIIRHGLDSKKQDIYTEHFHVDGTSLKEGDQVKRGQTIGLIGRGKYTLIPHYHYVVRKREGPGKFIVTRPHQLLVWN